MPLKPASTNFFQVRPLSTLGWASNCYETKPILEPVCLAAMVYVQFYKGFTLRPILILRIFSSCGRDWRVKRLYFLILEIWILSIFSNAYELDNSIFSSSLSCRTLIVARRTQLAFSTVWRSVQLDPRFTVHFFLLLHTATGDHIASCFAQP